MTWLTLAGKADRQVRPGGQEDPGVESIGKRSMRMSMTMRMIGAAERTPHPRSFWRGRVSREKREAGSAKADGLN